MNSRLRLIALCAPLTLLSACGGGGEYSPQVTLVNLFVGLWINGCEPDGLGGSSAVRISLDQLGPESVSGGMTVRNYLNANCSGLPSSTFVYSIVQHGTKNVGGEVAIRIELSGTGGYNTLMLVSDGQLYWKASGLPGSDGYPDSISFSSPLSKN